ncbi:hypothetical protein ACQKMW_09975 [Pseudomonas sivasensis]|jgi:hypothetical protein|nr:hypothetical protein [Pseudomonas sp. 2995-1]
MISLPDDIPDNPVLPKQLLLEALSRQEEVPGLIKPTSSLAPRNSNARAL